MSIFHDPAVLMQKARQQLQEKAVNPYAVGMSAAMNSTGDEPPLKKSTINKAHKIAKSIQKNGYEAEGEVVDEGSVADRARNVVSNQRLDDAQRDTQKSIDKLRNTPTVTRASASLAAKSVERQVKKSAAYGPQGQGQSRGFGTTGAYRIEKPKPTGSKPNAYRIEKPKPTGSKPGASSSLGGAGTPSGTGRYTPGGGGRYGIAGIGLADQYETEGEVVDEKVGLSIVSAREPKYDRNEQGEVKINPANVLRFAGKKLANAAGVKRKIRIRIGEEVGEIEIEEGMSMKDFKQQRSRQKQKDKREAEKTSPLRRAGIHDDKASPERAARHRANVDPDFEGNDERNYPGGKLRRNKVRKAKALGELGESVIIHLIENGFAETEQNAQNILRNMSESWVEEILSELSLGQIGGAVERAADTYAKPALEKIGAQKGREKAGPFGRLPGVGDAAAEVGRRTAGSLYDQGKDAIKKGDVNTAIKTGRTALDMLRNSYEHEVYADELSELNRLEREQGKESGGSSDEAYRSVKRTIRGMEGKPAGQRKKEKGKKPPAAGEYGGPHSPAQKVAKRRADAQRAQDMMHSPRD